MLLGNVHSQVIGEGEEPEEKRISNCTLSEP